MNNRFNQIQHTDKIKSSKPKIYDTSKKVQIACLIITFSCIFTGTISSLSQALVQANLLNSRTLNSNNTSINSKPNTVAFVDQDADFFVNLKEKSQQFGTFILPRFTVNKDLSISENVTPDFKETLLFFYKQNTYSTKIANLNFEEDIQVQSFWQSSDNTQKIINIITSLLYEEGLNINIFLDNLSELQTQKTIDNLRLVSETLNQYGKYLTVGLPIGSYQRPNNIAQLSTFTKKFFVQLWNPINFDTERTDIFMIRDLNLLLAKVDPANSTIVLPTFAWERVFTSNGDFWYSQNLSYNQAMTKYENSSNFTLNSNSSLQPTTLKPNISYQQSLYPSFEFATKVSQNQDNQLHRVSLQDSTSILNYQKLASQINPNFGYGISNLGLIEPNAINQINQTYDSKNLAQNDLHLRTLRNTFSVAKTGAGSIVTKIQ